MAVKTKSEESKSDTLTASETTKGRMKIIWDGLPVLVGPIHLDAGGYKHKGKMKQYLNLDGQPEGISLIPTKAMENGVPTMVMLFDLDDPEQFAKAKYVKQAYDDGLFTTLGNKLKVVNEFDQTVEKGKNIRRRNKLMGTVEEKIAEGTVSLRNLALNLGIAVKGLKNSIIEAKVLQMTDVTTNDKYDWLEKLINDPHYEIKATLLYAKERDIVTLNNKNWMYGDTHLGIDFEHAVKFCATNDTTFNAIKEQTDAM